MIIYLIIMQLSTKYKNIIIFTVIFIFATFLSSLIVDYDYDLFARLEVGECFVKLHKILKYDIFSYTPTHSWYDHEWGSGVLFYIFKSAFGAFGLILLNGLLLAITAFVGLKIQEEKKYQLRYPLIFSFILLSIIFCTDGSLIRCQTISYMFYVITIFLLEKYKQNESAVSIYILPVVILIWNNFHGGVATGLGVILIYLFGFIITHRKLRHLLFSYLISLFVLVINPYGIKFLIYLYYALTMDRSYIYEWNSVFHPYIFTQYWMLIVLFCGVLSVKIYNDIKNKKFEGIDYAVISAMLYMGCAHIKMLEFSTITIFIYCYNDIQKFISSKFTDITEKSIYSLIIVLTLMLPILSPTVPRATYRLFPLREIEFVKMNNLHGNIFVPFEMGSYASYKLYPNNLIYMDGRYEEVYQPKVFNDLLDFCNKRDGWEKIFTDYPTEIIIVEKSDPVYKELNAEQNWHEIYTGSLCGVFVKKENLKKSYKYPTKDILYYRKNMLKTDFIKNLEDK